MQCPCGSGALLAACCGPPLEGATPAKTAEALMRSRYTAYALGKPDYIAETHDPDTRHALDPSATREWAAKATWHGLEILSTRDGGEGDAEGEVEFVATYEQRGQRVRHHERSTFRRHGGRWYFRDGETIGGKPVVRDAPKVGRNDPCPCGSGKKHKKCCGRAAPV